MCYQAASIYVFGCVATYAVRLANTVLCLPFKMCCWWCCEFRDKKFPPIARSIGPWHGKTEAEVTREIVWRRSRVVIDELGPRPKPGEPQPRIKLFEAGIEIADIAQGGLGDCWLVQG